MPHKTQVALDWDQMKWVRSKPSIENEAPNWLGANTNNPGGAREEHSEACLPYVAGMRDEKQIQSTACDKTAQSSVTRNWSGYINLLALKTNAQYI